MLNRLLTLIVIFLISSTAYAQMPMGSVKTAIFLVDGFFDETMYITRDLSHNKQLAEAMNVMLDRKDNTISSLKTIRWTEPPGKDRYDKVYKIVEEYSEAQIETLMGLREGPERRKIIRAVKTMKALKRKKLKTLRETRKYETFRSRTPPPVPIVDKSPFESGGKTGSGGEMWF
ncbi:MAG: hypothetical protein ACE5DW_05950, partial [Thermodesulfobacteriota bacterium]